MNNHPPKWLKAQSTVFPKFFEVMVCEEQTKENTFKLFSKSSDSVFEVFVHESDWLRLKLWIQSKLFTVHWMRGLSVHNDLNFYLFPTPSKYKDISSMNQFYVHYIYCAFVSFLKVWKLQVFIHCSTIHYSKCILLCACKKSHMGLEQHDDRRFIFV